MTLRLLRLSSKRQAQLSRLSNLTLSNKNCCGYSMAVFFISPMLRDTFRKSVVRSFIF